MGLFEIQKMKIDKPIRLIELFAGIGAQAKALENLGVPFEHYRICEFDKYAVKSYNAVHGTDFEISDITKITASDLGIVQTDKYCYLMTYSFPCQDLSTAGKQGGMTKGGGTRSGLLWEVERLLNECEELPQVLLMENVPQVIGKKNRADFDKWCEFLRSKGYLSRYQLLNAKDYGIPQNRNRCFMVSWLKECGYDYEFPAPFTLQLRLKDMLEENVNEKYYLSERIINFFNRNSKEQEAKGNGFRFSPSDGNIIAHTITTRAGSRMDDNFIKQVDQIYSNSNNPQAGRIYDTEDLSLTMDTCSSGNRMPKIVEPVIAASRGRNPDNPSDRTAGTPTEQRLEIGRNISNTLTSVQKDNYVIEPAVIRMVRTDEGKALRKQYEAHEVEHGYNEYREAKPRTDGVSNALTSVQKDNLLFEPIIYDDYNSRIKADQSCIGTITTNIGNDAMRNGTKIIESTIEVIGNQMDTMHDTSRVVACDELVPTVKENHGTVATVEEVLPSCRIRKLTPKECWRLMGFSDDDFEKAHWYTEQEVKKMRLRKRKNGKDIPLDQKIERVSSSQLYKQAGNSIVVNVLMEIFKKML